MLRAAFQQAYIPEFTDDASVMEAAGHNIQLVEGNRENIKLTTPEDLIMAEALIRSWNDSAS
jgi:2-C-methyl-D-erythritol 4-phosphate cytidylyltransferase